MEKTQTEVIDIEIKGKFVPISSLSWDEASESLHFPKPNTDGFYEQMQERDRKLKEAAIQNLSSCVQIQ